MNKYINLFQAKRKKDSQSKILITAKLYATIAGIGLFLIFVVVVVLEIQQKSQLDQLDKEKQTYLSFFLANKNTEAKLKFFKEKEQQLNKFNSDDANFVPYYTLLKETINTSTNPAVINSIVIDKDRKTHFSLEFNDYQAMISFLRYIESDTFLKNFLELSLSSFNLIDNNQPENLKVMSQNFQLTFDGRFTEINAQNKTNQN